jgi:hypothetical protein
MKNDINLITILNLIISIGFTTESISLIPDRFFYEDYEFERTFRINDERPQINLHRRGNMFYILEDETDLNIVYEVLKTTFKTELRKLRIGKLINESK